MPNVTATFSEAIDPASVEHVDVSGLRDPAGDIVAGASGTTPPLDGPRLDPTAELTAGTRYIATMKGGQSGVADSGRQPTRGLMYTWGVQDGSR